MAIPSARIPSARRWSLTDGTSTGWDAFRVRIADRNRDGHPDVIEESVEYSPGRAEGCDEDDAGWPATLNRFRGDYPDPDDARGCFDMGHSTTVWTYAPADDERTARR